MEVLGVLSLILILILGLVRLAVQRNNRQRAFRRMVEDATGGSPRGHPGWDGGIDAGGCGSGGGGD
jgi:hypothetical protein